VVGVVVTAVVDGFESTEKPDGSVPDAVAVFTIGWPASMSACVTAYDAVHVIDVPAASVAAGQTTAPAEPLPLNIESSIAILDNVTLPVFVTRNK